MRRGALALACWTALAIIPAAAPAQTSLVVAGRLSAARYQRWVASAAVPTPHTTIALQDGLCPGAPSWAAACSLPLQHQIWLTSEGRQSSVFFHELGHVFDWLVMTDSVRARFAALIRRPGEWNWTTTNRNPPVEQFAEAYSMCARHRTIRAVAYGNYDYTPTPARHRRACALLRSAARHPAAHPAPPPAISPTRRPCGTRARSRCRLTVRRIDRYPDVHEATSVSGLVVRVAPRASVTPSTVVVDGSGLAALTPKALLAPFSLLSA
jgi:hypothetical protein